MSIQLNPIHEPVLTNCILCHSNVGFLVSKFSLYILNETQTEQRCQIYNQAPLFSTAGGGVKLHQRLCCENKTNHHNAVYVCR